MSHGWSWHGGIHIPWCTEGCVVAYNFVAKKCAQSRQLVGSTNKTPAKYEPRILKWIHVVFIKIYIGFLKNVIINNKI